MRTHNPNKFTLAITATLIAGLTIGCTVRDDDHAGGGAECDAPTIVVDGQQPDASNPDARVDAPIDAGVDAPTDAPTLAQCYISIERVGGNGEISEENQSFEELRVCRRMSPSVTSPVCTDATLEVSLAFTGMATRNSDYTVAAVVDFSSASQGSIDIQSGIGCANFVVTAQQDTVNEGTEDIDICVVDTSSYQLGSPTCQEITVRDDDQTVNHTPVANPDTATTPEDTMTVINVMDNDQGLNDLPLTLTATDPLHGSTVVAGNAVQYTPDPDFCGTDTFSYTVRDADNQTATAQVTVTVTCNQVCPAVTLSFGITPVTGGGGYTIAWDSGNANSCTASGAWSGNRPLDGSVIVNPTANGTHTYVLTCTSPCGAASVVRQGTITVTAPPQPTLCHGAGSYYKQSDLPNIAHCWGYPRVGNREELPKGTLVWGNTGTCAITCEGFDGKTIMPLAHTMIWVPNGVEDVPRWYTTGCWRLPDHPAHELDDYLHGGTWDGRCATAVQTLSGPPNTNQ